MSFHVVASWPSRKTGRGRGTAIGIAHASHEVITLVSLGVTVMAVQDMCHRITAGRYPQQLIGEPQWPHGMTASACDAYRRRIDVFLQ